ncbi:hypothetical protein B0H10DRAFT_1971552 [Mycena sp. CBHHK59/15]|nr:hypothetical protein B0H10DRAFT_1971552 [Mycena sp. CBHHK59/15]
MNQAGEPWNEIHRLTIAKLWGELSEDEQEECRQKAMSINNGEISESDKLRLASALADKDIAAFVQRMQEIYGVRMVCLSSWTDIKGKTQTSVHERSLSPKFSQQFPKWKVQKGVVNSFLEYSESFKDVGSNNSSDEEGERNYKRRNIPGQEGHGNHKDWDGYPLLPEVPKMLGTEWIGGAKIMIRAFVKEVLKPATGSSSPPWTAMATPEGARSLIVEKYLPVGVGLKDSSRCKKPLAFKVEEVRQKVAEDGRLCVAALKPKKRAYVEVDDEDPLSEEDGSSKKKRKPSKDHTKQVNKGKGKAATTRADAVAKENGDKPKAQMIVKPDARKAILFGLDPMTAYHLLVKQVLKSSRAGRDMGNLKSPSWVSWNVKDVTLVHDFYDPANNSTGYLSTWKSVLTWMDTNPHILTLGILRETRACAEADPESPLYHIAFSMDDFGIVQAAISKMHEAMTKREEGRKKSAKFGIGQAIHRSIDSVWRKRCREFQILVTNSKKAETVDAILEEDWCHRGRGGLVCFVLGMKWWRLSMQRTNDKTSLAAWMNVLSEMEAAFRMIVEAKSFNNILSQSKYQQNPALLIEK